MSRSPFFLGFIVWIVSASAACGNDEPGGSGLPDAAVGVDAPPADAGTDAPTVADSGMAWPRFIGGDRPARVIVPNDYDASTDLPLIILLHGYSASGMIQDLYWGVSPVTRERGVILVLPDGTVDSSGNHFWNATPACCDRDGTGVDDVAYLRGLITEAKAEFAVDATRVYFIGHSNGGFMSFRMACEAADEVAAIMSLAGSDFIGEMDCVPSRPVSVLVVHGNLDDTVAYDGAPFYPSAEENARRWAGRAGCDVDATAMGMPLDLVDTLAGEETLVTQWQTGCMPGLDAELWRIEGGSHVPGFTDVWVPGFLDWLLRHQQ